MKNTVYDFIPLIYCVDVKRNTLRSPSNIPTLFSASNNFDPLSTYSKLYDKRDENKYKL